jgi:hypothetical protein
MMRRKAGAPRIVYDGRDAQGLRFVYQDTEQSMTPRIWTDGNPLLRRDARGYELRQPAPLIGDPERRVAALSELASGVYDVLEHVGEGRAVRNQGERASNGRALGLAADQLFIRCGEVTRVPFPFGIDVSGSICHC